MYVQIIKAVIARRGNHEVAAGVSHHALNVAFIVPSRGSAKLVIKQVMRLQFRKPTCADARLIVTKPLIPQLTLNETSTEWHALAFEALRVMLDVAQERERREIGT